MNVITKRIIFFAVAVSVALCVSCAANDSKKLIKKGLYDCSGRLAVAFERMEKKSYTNVLRILDEIKYQCGGSPQMDTVHYYAGMANLRLKQYVEARDEFEALYREFPRSPFTEEAYFRVAHMRYIQSHAYFRDQSETREAMRLFGDYLDMYPGGAFADSAKHFFMMSLDKLAQKEFRWSRCRCTWDPRVPSSNSPYSESYYNSLAVVYNVVTGKTLALPNLIALQHIPLSPAGVIAKRPAPIALPNSCAAEWRMAPDAVFSPYASVRYFTPHMVHSQYNLL